jgi:hypothetical protein
MRRFRHPGVVPTTMAAHNIRIPDLAVSCSPFQLAQPAPTDPVLIIETLSRSNRAQTWANVWAGTSIANVQEIVVLRAEAVGGDLLKRNEHGTWPDRASLVEGDFTLQGIGMTVALAALYQRTPLSQV